MIEWHNKLPRYSGAFPGSHTLAYAMLFFSFFYCILHHVYQFNNSLNRFIIGFFLILSFYCLLKSHTRTAIIGFILFWYIYLWGKNKRTFFITIIIAVFVGIVFSGYIYKFIFKKDKIDLNTATSGRVWIIMVNTKLFIDSSFTQQLFGRGLGHEARFPFHNDYLALLMSLGVIGLFLYLIILFYLLWDIFLCKDKNIKYLFGGILISVAAINFGSNAVIFRVELSQYFWIIMGLFYCMPKIRNGEYDTKPSDIRNY